MKSKERKYGRAGMVRSATSQISGVSVGADDNGGTFFGGRLISKRERHQYNITELIADHKRHRPRYPTPC